MKMPLEKISIIIPVFNEAKNIATLLEQLLLRMRYKHHEILLIDGGSTDTTVEIISDFISHYNRTNNHHKKRCIDQLVETDTATTHLQLFQSEKGRAKQMNYGAHKATATILYFLHADTLPPKHFDQYMLQKVSKGHQAGCFRMKFDSWHPVLLVSQFFTRFNVSWCRGGDQSLFIVKSLFHELKGFNEEYSIYEDCEFIHRLYAEDEFTVIPKNVITSARKYREKGTWKLQYHFAIIHFKKSKGASPEELHSYYKKYVAT